MSSVTLDTMLAGLPKAISVLNYYPRTNQDYTVVCNGHEFYCHKSILIEKSKYFKGLLGGEFKESKLNRFEHSEKDDVQVIKAMLEFCYYLSYRPWEDNVDLTPEFHARMCVLDEYYAIEGLEQYAGNKFAASLIDAPILQLHSALSEAYAAAGPAHMRCRKIILDYFQANEELLTGGDEQFIALLEDYPDFAADLIRTQFVKIKDLKDKMPTKKVYPCTNCETFSATILDDEIYTHRCTTDEETRFEWMQGQGWETRRLESTQQKPSSHT